VTDAPDKAAKLNDRELRQIRAQAAVWVTDLHGPGRDAELESGVRRWLAEDPRHARAFELATDAWQRSGNLPLSLVAPIPSNRGHIVSRMPASRLTLIGATVLSLALATALYILRDSTISTGAAEQKTVDLTDGTQVTLNANSRLKVDYAAHRRSVQLDQGEAIFRVAHDIHRPFVVRIGRRQVTALGTVFDIRREDTRHDDFTVTLIEGRIAVAKISTSALPDQQPTQLETGQRLRINADAPTTLDAPSIDKVTAWQRGQLIFEDTSIHEAAAEFNRYGNLKIIIDSSVPDTLRFGGVFRLSDPRSFAAAMANAYQLHILERNSAITLSR
jgi:transmembrane sensor